MHGSEPDASSGENWGRRLLPRDLGLPRELVDLDCWPGFLHRRTRDEITGLGILRHLLERADVQALAANQHAVRAGHGYDRHGRRGLHGAEAGLLESFAQQRPARGAKRRNLSPEFFWAS